MNEVSGGNKARWISEALQMIFFGGLEGEVKQRVELVKEPLRWWFDSGLRRLCAADARLSCGTTLGFHGLKRQQSEVIYLTFIQFESNFFFLINFKTTKEKLGLFSSSAKWHLNKRAFLSPAPPQRCSDSPFGRLLPSLLFVTVSRNTSCPQRFFLKMEDAISNST